MTNTSWQEKAALKAAQAAEKIPEQWRLSPDFLSSSMDATSRVLDIPAKCGILTEKEISITENYDATALLEKLASRELSSVEVTTAFSKRAAIAQQLTSCLTETFFEMALSRAQQLDDYLAETGKTVGPLHGLPVSLKESFSVTGIHTSLGIVSFLDRPPKSENSALVDVLLAAGAVLYVKTNIPQTMMSADSHNHIFGRVLNPYRLNLTAGGSSGGEGALIAMRGSVLGIGTDVGGSIRIPALCCGVFGFKPSASRVPYGGQTAAVRPGMPGILPVAGPLCHSTRDAELLLKTVFNSNAADLDETVLGVPWIIPQQRPILTIGIMPEDPLRPLHPPMQRTIKTVSSKLEACGHRIIDLSSQIPSLSEVADLSLQYFRIDPDQVVIENVTKSGEPCIPSLKHVYDPEDTGPEPHLRELFEMNITRAKLLSQMRRAFVDNNVDLILGAGYQSPAVPHDEYGLPVYTVIGNLMNNPACILPYAYADEGADADFVRDVVYKPEYRPKEVEGAPCHIQLIGRPMKDEQLLQDAAVVEKALKR
ncbi:amidase [Aspergillus steynii IBT 23096]|uniref:amidase n=1 Tax=Aspergillus steynii IBT 23096 TaxID=1392250 RepID=A0A2I2GEC7_9EURO|nr:amidase [Aspergillus steynii IBT 23096]PLB51233.1 amidase [Aspergillus steynii IBT 23096]